MTGDEMADLQKSFEQLARVLGDIGHETSIRLSVFNTIARQWYAEDARRQTKSYLNTRRASRRK
jgi:hypothetical protein